MAGCSSTEVNLEHKKAIINKRSYNLNFVEENVKDRKRNSVIFF